ncbi:MAG: stage II sporulation protein M [Candidatus Woesearchaeota archaeon]
MILRMFEKHWKDNHGFIALLIGFLFSSLSLLIAQYLFRHNIHLIGTTTIFFTVIFTMPILNHILTEEEKIERKKGNFFKKNDTIIDFYLYFFLGVFMLFLLAAFITPEYVFSKDDFYNIDTTAVQTVEIGRNLPPPVVNDAHLVREIITNNIYIVLITFALSLLFGAGSIYIVVLNASMAAALLADLTIKNIGSNFMLSFACNWSLLSLHLVPEMLGFLVAAIAGGILYIDFKKEKFRSKNFEEVSLDSLKLLGISALLIIFGALIEVYMTAKSFQKNVCIESPVAFISFFVGIFLFAIFLEITRQKH